MPGAYAHIALANAAAEMRPLLLIPHFPVRAISAVVNYLNFCELGAVGPDFPSLAPDGGWSWAERLHRERTGALVRTGVRRLRRLSGEAKGKCFAWLMGYVSHLVGDATIHPVIRLKVGPAEENMAAHRLCEMHQDVLILHRMNFGGSDACDYLRMGIGRCWNGRGLDADLAAFWSGLLSEVHPEFSGRAPLDFGLWHARFRALMDRVDRLGRLPAWSRHAHPEMGLRYPLDKEVNRTFVADLAVPGGGPTMSYGKVFDRAAENVREAWTVLALGVYAADEAYADFFRDWDLDTGEAPDGKPEFWRD